MKAFRSLLLIPLLAACGTTASTSRLAEPPITSTRLVTPRPTVGRICRAELRRSYCKSEEMIRAEGDCLERLDVGSADWQACAVQNCLSRQNVPFPCGFIFRTLAEWQQEAGNALGCNGSGPFNGTASARNARISGAYAELYASAPDRFTWAGLAAFASDEVGLGLKIGKALENGWALPPPFTAVGPAAEALQQLLEEGNKAVFEDIYWQHVAYAKYGLAEIERVTVDEGDAKPVAEAWRAIDLGIRTGNQAEIERGNEMLLYYEQSVTLQPIYDKHYLLAITLSPFMYSPVPGSWSPFQRSVPFGNIGNFHDRWAWIEEGIVPDWNALRASNPTAITAGHVKLKASAKEVCQ